MSNEELPEGVKRVVSKSTIRVAVEEGKREVVVEIRNWISDMKGMLGLNSFLQTENAEPYFQGYGGALQDLEELLDGINDDKS